MAPFTKLSCFLVLLPIFVRSDDSCQQPKPAANFTLPGYYGRWFEVAKIQTKGGAAFEKDCVCTNINVSEKNQRRNNQAGDCTVINSCRKKTPQGDYLNATGTLEDMSQPGKWKESLFWFVPKVDYTVIYQDEDFTVEYDCGQLLGQTNYCIHIMARTPKVDMEKVSKLSTWAQSLGLNPEKLPLQITKQDGCWS